MGQPDRRTARDQAKKLTGITVKPSSNPQASTASPPYIPSPAFSHPLSDHPKSRRLRPFFQPVKTHFKNFLNKHIRVNIFTITVATYSLISYFLSLILLCPKPLLGKIFILFFFSLPTKKISLQEKSPSKKGCLVISIREYFSLGLVGRSVTEMI